jgi:hypothetical protein
MDQITSELKEIKDRLSLVLSSVDDFLLESDLYSAITDVNNAALRADELVRKRQVANVNT